LLENAITPIQQYGYTSGKNATDSAMIIDAMDILYSGKVGGFCLVSSDSDFTRLATRLREAGMKVFGMGEKKTPEPFIVACDKFIYIEILQASAKEEAPGTVVDNQQKEEDNKITERILKMISTNIDELDTDEGTALLRNVGNLLQKKQPIVDSRNYGFTKLTPLIRSIDSIEIDE